MLSLAIRETNSAGVTLMQNTIPVLPYPGTSASLGQMLELAQAYLAAAYKLMDYDTGNPLASAPVRLVSIQSLELYLNAFLLISGEEASTIRGLQHDLGKRSALAVGRGLVLKKRTETHLLSLSDNREYLTSRYGPELSGTWSQLNAIHATLKEVSEKIDPIVRAGIARQFAAR
jgi:hypothetical protein